MNAYKAKVLAKNQLTEKIYQLDLALPQPFSFKAGQCVGFRVSESYKRLYSIASLPADPKNLSFCIDVSPMGQASKFILGLASGSEFEIEGPYGAFVAGLDSQDLLFVATGAGVAPFKGIISDLLQKGFSKKITLLFGVRHQADLFYQDYFEALAQAHSNFEFLPTLSQPIAQPKGDWQGIKGRVTEYLEKNIQQYIGRTAYVCGSIGMVKDVRAFLLAKGFNQKQIKIEIFV